MRDHVTPNRGGRNRANERGRAASMTQRPVPRRSRPVTGGERTGRASSSWKSALRYFPLLAKLTLAVTLGILVFVGYRTAASAAFFGVKSVDIDGASRASTDEIKEVAIAVAGRTGVWRADLAAIGEEVERLPWVKTAVVSRVLPSGIRVRVSERTPIVISRSSAGRLVWVDADGVALGAATPSAEQFFIRGLDEGRGESTVEHNRERIRVAVDLAREWQAAGVSSRVSEVNLEDLRDVRVQLAGTDAHVEMRLGREDYVKRFGQGLEVLDTQRQTARGPFITYIDVSQGKRAIVGTGANAHYSLQDVSNDAAIENTTLSAGQDARDETTTPASASGSTLTRTNKRNPVKNKEKKSTGREETATRPRRVG